MFCDLGQTYGAGLKMFATIVDIRYSLINDSEISSHVLGSDRSLSDTDIRILHSN